MHTWAPSYNQTLPSIYQIVNGLIKFFFYVDNIYIHTHTHTHVLDMHTCMFVQCTQSTSALCYFLLAPSFLAGSVFSAKVVGVWELPDEGTSHCSPVKQTDYSDVFNFFAGQHWLFQALNTCDTKRCASALIDLMYLNIWRAKMMNFNAGLIGHRPDEAELSPHTFKYKFTDLCANSCACVRKSVWARKWLLIEFNTKQIFFFFYNCTMSYFFWFPICFCIYYYSICVHSFSHQLLCELVTDTCT